MFKRILILVGVMGWMRGVEAQPPTMWTHTLGGNGSDAGCCVQQTVDGGYVIAGWTDSFGAGDFDVYLIKTDANGNQMWQQTYGGSDDDYGYSVQQTSDGGYVIAGYSQSYSAGDCDAMLIKTDAEGNQTWTHTFGWILDDYGYSVQQTTDGGYIIVGTTQYDIFLGTDVYLVKTDSSGNETWEHTFGGDNIDHGKSVQQTMDGGYVIAGYTNSYGAGYSDVYLIKTDANGIQTWQHTYGGNEIDVGYDVQQTTDGGYALTGGTYSYGSGLCDVYLIKTDADGHQIWQQTYGGSNTEYGGSLQQTADSGYVITGYTYSYGAGYTDVYLVKTDTDGNQTWQSTYGGSSYDYGGCVRQTTDGGYIIAGSTINSLIVYYSDVYLIKTAAEEIPNVAITLTPLSVPIQIPATGGSFDYNIAVANNEPTQQTGDVWCMVTLPNGNPYGPVLGPANVTMPVGFSGDRDRTQDVPASAPSGPYTYHGYVGDYPSIIWDEDSFTFEKLTTGDGQWMGNWNNYGAEFGDWFAAVDNTVTPEAYSLNQNYPNPFNPTTTIRFDLPQAGWVKLEVFDVVGRMVGGGNTPALPLVNGWREAGAHEVTFDGSGLASGVYIYRLKVTGSSGSGTTPTTMSGKMVLLK